MKEAIKKILLNKKTKRISITELGDELKKRRINIFSDESKKNQFVKIIQDLIDENILIPLKNALPLQQYGRLPRSFTIQKSIISEKFAPLPIEHLHELLSLFPPINIDYYATHAAQYVKDREFILRINDLIRQNDFDELTINERSYLLFDDEKAISLPMDAAVNGSEILKNLKITLEDIKAKKVHEPFFYTEKKYFSLAGQAVRTILIIENKDTFWTFQQALKSGDLDKVNMIVYGEGHAINQKFTYFEMIGGSISDNYYYFGDLDQEGIHIFNSLRKKFHQYDIKPAVNLYTYILKKVGSDKAKPLRTHQQSANPSLSPFIDFFDSEIKDNINEIITNRKYLPQEIFNKTDLQELKRCGIF